MKFNKSVLLAFVILIVVASVSRVLGFAPQIAMALFGGAMIKDKKLSFALPLLSMFLSDVLYEVLFSFGYAPYGGFYEGQILNYLIIASLTFIGFWVAGMNVAKIAVGSVVAPTLYFVLSNFAVWAGGGGYQRPKTLDGLMMCFADALPFYRSGVVSTVIFTAILFGGFYLLQRLFVERKQLA